MTQGKLELSRGHLEEALEIHRKLEDKRGLAYIQRDLANHAILMGRFREAELQARKALDLFENIGARFGFAQTLSSLGEIHRAQGHYQAASDMHTKALAIFEALNGFRDIAMTHYYLGATSFKLGRPSEAKAQFERSLEVSTSKHYPSIRGLALAGAAWTAAASGRIGASRNLLDEANDALYDDPLLVPDLAEIYADCADAFERAGDVDLAEECREKATTIWEGLGRRPP